MDLKTLKKDLSSNPKTINLHGSEEVFRKQAIDTLIKHYVESGTEDFNVVFVSDESEKDINTILQETPFSSQFRIVFLNNGYKYINYRTEDTVMVALDNSIDKAHYSIDCSRIYGRQLKAVIRSKAKQLGLDMDKEDIDLFVSLNGNSLLLLETELAKLELLGEKSSKIFKELASTNVRSRLDLFFNALVTKDSSMAANSIYKLKNNGVQDSQLYGFLVYSLKNLMLISFVEEDTIESYDMLKLLKYKNQLDFQFIIDIFKYMVKLDFLFKNGEFPFVIFAISICKRNFLLSDNYIKYLHNGF